MTTQLLRLAPLCLLPALLASAVNSAPEAPDPERGQGVKVYYLEIVTPDVDATCSALEKLHGVKFGEPQADLGNGRTAPLEGGDLISVRAPLRDDEEPIVRPYLLVDDIESAVEAAGEAGAVIALPPIEIPGRGRFAIYIQGGIEHGLWEL